MSRIVTAAMVAVRDEAHKVHYFYRGALLPEFLPAAEVRRLADEGFIGEEIDLAALPVVDEPFVAQPTPEVIVPDLETGPKRPPQVAAKAAWVDWAVASGMPADDAEAATKQDLIDRYGG